MSPLTITLLCISIILIVIIILLIRKQKKGLATIFGFICVILLAVCLVLDIFVSPLKYKDQTKESYLAMQQNKDLSGYRVRVDNKITNKYPEWDDESPLNFFVDYANSEIRIYTADYLGSESSDVNEEPETTAGE